MTETAEIVTEATVVDVSPARDSVYAVTLQVRNNFDVSNNFDHDHFVGEEDIQGQARVWRTRGWTLHSVVVSQTQDQEESSDGTKEVPGGLYLRHGPEEREEVQLVPGSAAWQDGLQQGTHGQVLHDSSSSPGQQEVYSQDPLCHVPNMR